MSEAVAGLARDLFLLDAQIETSSRSDSAGALALLEQENYDAVAVDLNLPGDVPGLLSALATRFPRIIRLVIADDPAASAFASAAHLAHGLLPRPCDAGTLYDVLQDTMATVRRRRDPALTDAVSSILALPQSPAMRRELLGLLADDDIRVDQIEDGVQRNPAIAAKLLQIANSAYYGPRGTVSSVGEAVSMLGLDTVRGIVTAAHLFAALPAGAKDQPVGDIWSHCVATAVMVRRVAWHVRASAATNRAAFTAALLHDVGKIVMLHAHGEEYAKLRQLPPPRRPLWQEEECLFGHHHGVAGSLLLELWGLPASVVEAVALHHTPHRTPENTLSPLALVHIANALVHGEMPAPAV